MIRDERMVIMKYTYKITASLLAALMMAGTAVAVPAADFGFGTSVSAAYNTYAYATNISYKLYNSYDQLQFWLTRQMFKSRGKSVFKNIANRIRTIIKLNEIRGRYLLQAGRV